MKKPPPTALGDGEDQLALDFKEDLHVCQNVNSRPLLGELAERLNQAGWPEPETSDRIAALPPSEHKHGVDLLCQWPKFGRRILTEFENRTTPLSGDIVLRLLRADGIKVGTNDLAPAYAAIAARILEPKHGSPIRYRLRTRATRLAAVLDLQKMLEMLPKNGKEI